MALVNIYIIDRRMNPKFIYPAETSPIFSMSTHYNTCSTFLPSNVNTWKTELMLFSFKQPPFSVCPTYQIAPWSTCLLLLVLQVSSLAPPVTRSCHVEVLRISYSSLHILCHIHTVGTIISYLEYYNTHLTGPPTLSRSLLHILARVISLRTELMASLLY